MFSNLNFVFSQTALVGAFQCFTLAVVLLSIKHFRLTNIFLVGFIVVHAIRLLLLYVLYGGYPVPRQEIFSLLGIGFALGPLLLFYVRSLTEVNFRWKWTYLWHFLPIVLVISIIAMPVIQEVGVEQDVYLWFRSELPMLRYRLDWLFPLLLNLSIAIYGLLALKHLVDYQHHILEMFSFTENISLKWLWWVIGLSLLAASVSTFSHIMRLFFSMELGPRLYVWLLVTVLQIMVIAIMGLKQQFIFAGWQDNSVSELPETDEARGESGAVTGSVDSADGQEEAEIVQEETAKGAPPKEKYQKSGLTDETGEDYWQRLESYMQNDRPYLSCTLNLNDLAAGLGVPRDHLSQVINTYSEGKFFDYVNGYRLEHAKGMLREEKGMSILDIALESGFSSQSSFSNRFRKQEGCSPSEYRKKA